MAGPLAETGTPPDSAPQMPLKTDFSSSAATILREGGERRADEVDPAHELFPAVREDPVHHDGQDVEGVGDGAAGQREAALDVVEEEAEGLALMT